MLEGKVSDEITYKNAKEVIKGLEENNLFTAREVSIILHSIEDKVLCIPILQLKDKVRAKYFAKYNN